MRMPLELLNKRDLLFDFQMKDITISEEMEICYQRANGKDSKAKFWKMLIDLAEAINSRKRVLISMDEEIIRFYNGQVVESELGSYSHLYAVKPPVGTEPLL